MSSSTPSLTGAYELVFYKRFKDGLEILPKEIYPIVDRTLAQLLTNPFAKNLNAKPIKNASDNRFRAKIGIHVRMIYRVLTKEKRIAILNIGSRQNFYDKNTSTGRQLTPTEGGDLVAKLRSTPQMEQATSTSMSVNEIPVSIEKLTWITEDELFFLQIHQEQWPAILDAHSLEELRGASIDNATKNLVGDYLTNPAATQVEKLYTLEPGEGAESVANKPLSHFLIALDPDQKQALKRIKADGPNLIKGSAGTGKSLVGLYHIRNLITSRIAESLFDSDRPLYGVITYTNSLVQVNRDVLQNIAPVNNAYRIRHTTLDKVAYKLTCKELGVDWLPLALDTKDIANLIKQKLTPQLKNDALETVHRIGFDYLASEIEQVIHGYGLATIGEYLTHDRRGRKRGLRDSERRVVWAVHTALAHLLEEKGQNRHTFAQRRLLALQYLKAHPYPEYPRFTALFVDEAQDLSLIARRLCLELVRDPKNLLLAADTSQSIYVVPPSWRQTDRRFDFRRRRPVLLERSYRATRQINEAIAPLRMDLGDEDDLCTRAQPIFTGPTPKWINAPSKLHADLIGNEIKLLMHGPHPINLSQIAVITHDHAQNGKIQRALQKLGIKAISVRKDLPIQISGNQVHIITAHSSKGLGFPIVFAPYVDADSYPRRKSMLQAKDDEQRAQIEENEQRLFYVALSRASHRLYMLVDAERPSPFVQKFNRTAHWDCA